LTILHQEPLLPIRRKKRVIDGDLEYGKIFGHGFRSSPLSARLVQLCKGVSCRRGWIDRVPVCFQKGTACPAFLFPERLSFFAGMIAP
jgi:hypothetical protein